MNIVEQALFTFLCILPILFIQGVLFTSTGQDGARTSSSARLRGDGRKGPWRITLKGLLQFHSHILRQIFKLESFPGGCLGLFHSPHD